MSSTNNSSNRMVVPEAKEAMDKFKMEVASELGVPDQRLQWKPDLLPERQRRRLYGEEDDRGTGEEDGGQIKAA